MNIDLRCVLQSLFSIPRISFCYLASPTLNTAITLSGHTKSVISLTRQPRIRQCSLKHIHMKDARVYFSVSPQQTTPESKPGNNRALSIFFTSFPEEINTLGTGGDTRVGFYVRKSFGSITVQSGFRWFLPKPASSPQEERRGNEAINHNMKSLADEGNGIDHGNNTRL